MDISAKGKNTNVGDALRGYVSEQLRASAGKYFARAHDGIVIVLHEAHLVRVDISVHPVAGLLVQGHGAAKAPYAVFGAALERVARQIPHYERRSSNPHREVAEGIMPAQHDILTAESAKKEWPDEAQPAIIAELPVEPGVMARNRAHGTLNAVYRRTNGNSAWIDSSRIQGT